MGLIDIAKAVGKLTGVATEVPDKPGSQTPATIGAPASSNTGAPAIPDDLSEVLGGIAPTAVRKHGDRTSQITTAEVPAPSPGRPQVDAQVYGRLRSAVDKKSPPNYVAFVQQMAVLEKVLPDVTLRRNAAMATANVTPEALRAASSQRLQALQSIMTQINGHFAQEIQANVSSLETQSQSVRSQISDKEQQLRRLTEELTTLRSQEGSLQKSIAAEREKQQGEQQKFQTAAAQLQDDITKEMNA